MDQVGRYQILEELGRGAHGIVYKALDPAIGRAIAIKAIALTNINPADRERVRNGILREARLAGTLSHPNIVTVYDVLDSGESTYIFMEFIDGKSLEKAIAEITANQPGKLNRLQFLSLFRQVAQALDYAHRKEVIHRDVKPANIVLTGEGDLVAKIADFGVAKFASQESTQPLGGYPALIGTPNYMSPEQIQGAPVSAASDQFSLAGIAYEVLCGRKAFVADSIEAVLYRIRNEPEEPVHLVNSMLSTTVTKVLQRALAKAPGERFESCGELAGALEFALGDTPDWQPGMLAAAEKDPNQAVVLYTIDDSAERQSWGRRLVLIACLCLAVVFAVVLMVRMNSGPAVVTQILDTHAGSVSPPPTVEELKYDRHAPTPPPLDLGQPDSVKAKTVPLRPAAAHPAADVPTVVNVEVPESRPTRKKAVVVRPVKQVITSAEVQLVTDPLGASIMVDGVNPCITPCSLTLPSGRHTLAARLDGFGITRKIFYVPADASIFLPLVKSEGVLLVSSEPSGATVSVDGKTAGTTPVTLRLAAGSHRVSVWDGAKWREQYVQVAADEVHTRTFRF